MNNLKTKTRTFFNGLRECQTYYVSGNPQWRSGRMYDMLDYLNSVGVNILRGNCDEIKKGDETLIIYEIDDDF